MAQKILKFVSFEPKIVKIALLSLKSWIHESILAVNKAFSYAVYSLCKIRTRLAIM